MRSSLLMMVMMVMVMMVMVRASVSTVHTASHSNNPNTVSIIRKRHLPHPTLPTLGNPEALEVELDPLGPPLNPDDLATGSQLGHHPRETEGPQDPILQAGKFQGDIVIDTKEQLDQVTGAKAHLRNGIPSPDNHWPNGTIPYVISAKFENHERGVIARAIKNYEELTCVTFVPRSTQKDFVHIFKGIGCSSSVGRVGGAQAVSLGLGCLNIGIVMHELMHAIGFWHEHTRPDRDSYITVNWRNIRPGMEHNFKPFASEEVQTLGVEYDLGSVMHYGPHAFAKDINEPTILPKIAGVTIGQRRGLSLNDKRKVNLMYCKDTPIGVSTSAPNEDWCKDNTPSCKAWAASGECKINPSYMFVNCCWSCLNHAPAKEDVSCKDNHHYCRGWADTGECVNSAPYMTIYCKKSCNICN